MQFATNLNEFNNNLKTMALAVPKLATLPLLQSIRLEAKYSEVILEGTNLEVALNIRMPAEVETEGVCFINLGNLRSGLPSRKSRKDQLALLELDGGELYVAYDDSTISLQPHTNKVEDWPDLEYVETAFTLQPEVIAAVKKCLPFVSTEDTRHFLNGVYIHNVDPEDGKRTDSITAVATTGKMLKVVRTGKKVRQGFSIILPTQACRILTSKFPEGPVEVGLAKEKRKLAGEEKEYTIKATFQADGIAMTSRLIEGQYPDYELIVKGAEAEPVGPPDEEGQEHPKWVESTITVNREQLLTKVLGCGKILPNKKGYEQKSMLIETVEDGIQLSASSKDGKGKVITSIPATWDEELSIEFNPHLLMPVLRSIDEEDVTLKSHSDGLSPGRFYGDSHEDTILMPMRERG